MNISKMLKIALIATFAVFSVDTSYAITSSSRSSFSSSSYSRPSSPSYSRPSTPTYTKPSTPVADKPTAVYSKPAVIAPAPVITASPKPEAPKANTVLGQQGDKSKSYSSFMSYKDKQKPTPSPASTLVSTQYGSHSNFVAARNQTVVVYHNLYPNSYIYSSHMTPYYGHYDSGFLMGLLIGEMGSNHGSNVNWVYSHQNDPWYSQWRADLEKQAQSNAELKQKLVDMDKELTDLKTKNATVVASVLPEGVTAAAAINPDAVDDEDENKSSWLWWSVFGILGIFGSITIGSVVFFYIITSKVVNK